MQRHVYRTLTIYAALAVAAICIYPTLGWMTLSDEQREARIARWNEEDLAVEEPSVWGDMTRSVSRWAQFDRARVINLGLDLQGGIRMVLGFELTPEAEERGLDEASVQELILQRVRNRVNEFEAKEPIIQKLGHNQIQIQLPGEKDIQRAKNLIMQTAYMTFHMVSGPDETNQVLRKIDTHFKNSFVPFLDPPFRRGGPYQVRKENYARVRAMVDEALSTKGVLPENKTLAFSPPPSPWEESGYTLYLMDKVESMVGAGLKSAVARPDNQSPGYWQILFEFKTDSAREFADVTEANVGRSMAIVVDGMVVSAPTINQRIFGSGTITGSFSTNEAQDLAIALNSGSMPVPVREDYTGVVGATLGADSVAKGVKSAIIGLVIVMGFMIVYYRVAGVVANIALTTNALLVLGALAYFGATLTLPGIAGLILTIGMAVDANVLIFERIREELRNGKSLASSIEGGYARATVTILDANVTTLIAAAVLTQFGTGPVQGFAVTLSIGVCASVFTALVITRAVMDFLSSRKWISDLAMMSILKGEPKLKFLAKRRVAAIASLVLIGIGCAVFAVRWDKNFGVDFTDGTNMVVALKAPNAVAVGTLRAALMDAGFAAPMVQEYVESGSDVGNQFIVRVGEVGDQTASVGGEGGGDTVSTRIQKALVSLSDAPESADLDAQVAPLKIETVGPAVGAQLQRDAVAAISYALLFIVAYLWFRFELKFAVGAVVALVHDVLFTMGIFAVMGREITIPVVAALLTIIGYSLNDTIVVFDRVRENQRLYRGRDLTFAGILDVSINQTLSRTILTSMTTLFVVVVLFIFGGNAINDFALALICGILVGTYSSIFIASPVVLLWQQLWGRDVVAMRGGTGGEEKGKGGSRRRRRKAQPE